MSALYGVIGVFATPEAVRAAAVRLRESGYREFETYTPFPVEGLQGIVHPGPRRALPLSMFAGAAIGALSGYWIQFWDEALSYPINVGGRPHNSWPAFVVSSFEFSVLFALAAGFFGLIAASRLPRLYHPLFNARSFERASRDRFLICVEATDPRFNADAVARLFEQLGAMPVERALA